GLDRGPGHGEPDWLPILPEGAKAYQRDALYENGTGSGGRPHGLPPLTVSHGTSFLVPVRLLLRVSTNSTGPSKSSKIEMSAGASTCCFPQPGTRVRYLPRSPG